LSIFKCHVYINLRRIYFFKNDIYFKSEWNIIYIYMKEDKAPPKHNFRM
jgi:hypothetical protein